MGKLQELLRFDLTRTHIIVVHSNCVKPYLVFIKILKSLQLLCPNQLFSLCLRDSWSKWRFSTLRIRFWQSPNPRVSLSTRSGLINYTLINFLFWLLKKNNNIDSKTLFFQLTTCHVVVGWEMFFYLFSLSLDL